MLHAWNQVHPDATVQPGDRVSKVNGVSTISGMGKELRSPSVAMEIIRYPASFEVELSKRAADDTLRKLGFKFEKPGGHGLKELKITEVGKDGLLGEANNKQAELGLFHYVVASDMRISKVNDVEGDASLISEELKTAEVVKIQIRRAEVQKLAKEKVIKSTELLGMVAALAKPELFARAAAVSKSDGPGSSLEAESQPATSGDEAAAADAAAAAAAAAT
ncbi:unnamed protein product [Polarella glacialis]|uniref:PDZ domain-containing protein n=1 Tax=Polarella glacialis TaxID=89957 RepID=A0A813IEN1_POLGL|nr:unnamed protein product [Polarella glacialis]